MLNYEFLYWPNSHNIRFVHCDLNQLLFLTKKMGFSLPNNYIYPCTSNLGAFNQYNQPLRMSSLPLVKRLIVEGNEVPDKPIPTTIDKYTTGLVSVDDQTSIVSSLSNKKEHLCYNMLLGRRRQALKKVCTCTCSTQVESIFNCQGHFWI